MKDLMATVTHTRWAKVELTCTGDNRFDVVFHTRRVPFGNRSNEFHAGDFHIQEWNLTSREVYSLIRHYFSTLANNGYEKLTDKIMRAIVDLRQTYFLTVDNRMDHIHQQANEENAAFDLEHNKDLYLVDLHQPEEEGEKTDLEGAKEMLRGLWIENEDMEDDELFMSIDTMSLKRVSECLRGCDYDIMTEREYLNWKWEELLKPAEGPQKDGKTGLAQLGRVSLKVARKDLKKLINGHWKLKALRYAEKHGIIEYKVAGFIMAWAEVYPNEGTYISNVDLRNMKETCYNLESIKNLGVM